MQAVRSSSARVRSTTVRATIMPPIDRAAMPWAVARRLEPFGFKLRSTRAVRIQAPLKDTDHRQEHGFKCEIDRR
jgi:hypothetical protein